MKFLLLLLAVLVVVSLTQVIQAEEIYNEFIGLENLFKDPNSVVKLYKSGGFSLKNYDLGMAIFAHPVSQSEMIKFTVFYDGKVSRFLIEKESISDETISEPISPVPSKKTEPMIEELMTEPTPKKIEPKSSIGADISKYDIPTISREDGKTDFLLYIKTNRMTTQYLNEEFVFNSSFINARNHTFLEDVKVTIEIVRDDFVLKKSSAITEKSGSVSIDFGYLTYPLFYPGFCYDINVKAVYKDHSNTWSDDFEIVSLAQYWNPDTSWIGNAAYSYYPEEYKTEPRSEINSDSKCND